MPDPITISGLQSHYPTFETGTGPATGACSRLSFAQGGGLIFDVKKGAFSKLILGTIHPRWVHFRS